MRKQDLQVEKQLAIQKTSLKNLDGNKEIQQTLVYCALMVGLKPEKIEIEIAEKFIKSNYKNITLEEIVNAFGFNSSGNYWKIIEPFGSFNTLFIGKILNANQNYLQKKKFQELKALPIETKKDLITHEEAKPLLKKLSEELKKMDLKFKINNK
jgi:copper chaperone CopZ